MISGKGISNEKIEFVEVNISGIPLSNPEERLETRYYVCDLSELNLKKAIYRIEWPASEKVDFVLSVEK